MFLSRNKYHIPLLLRRASGFMLVISLVFLLVWAVIVQIIQQREQNKVIYLLHHYLKVLEYKGPSGLQLSFSAAGNGVTAFLRLESPRHRLILLSNGEHNTPLPDFTSFPPEANLTWKALQSSCGPGPWTVASQQLQGKATLQIGISSRENLELLHTIRNRYLILSFLCLPFCFIPAWISLQTYRSRLKRLCKNLDQLTEEATENTLPPENGLTPEEKQLVAKVNTFLIRHKRLSRELQESMDNVAHDLRTPMTRLRSIAEYGLHKGDDNAHLQEALTDCLEESDRLLSMLNTMLSVTEAQANTITLDLQPVSLADSIGSVLDLYEIIAQENKVTIHFTASPDMFVQVDPARISQVWANLLDNAIKYNATTITIGLQQQGNMGEVTIADNGMGIAPGELDKIWTRLYRGDRSRSKPGLGLGLTLVQAMVKNHGGSVRVTSELNKGTTFTVLLPMATLKQIDTEKSVSS